MENDDKWRVVIDTNVILNALSPKLSYQHILRKAFRGGFIWCITTEVLLEYEEKIAEFYGETTALAFLEALMMSSYVSKVEVF